MALIKDITHHTQPRNVGQQWGGNKVKRFPKQESIVCILWRLLVGEKASNTFCLCIFNVLLSEFLLLLHPVLPRPLKWSNSTFSFTNTEHFTLVNIMNLIGKIYLSLVLRSLYYSPHIWFYLILRRPSLWSTAGIRDFYGQLLGCSRLLPGTFWAIHTLGPNLGPN